ncbi:hypothetical protein CGRA01v4_09908 [Colletotrichum graminicola]|nr:hypothetical protein CGRA01v4_09908 [Colletotrichum graminicola]
MLYATPRRACSTGYTSACDRTADYGLTRYATAETLVIGLMDHYLLHITNIIISKK